MKHRFLGRADYIDTFEAMKAFTRDRDASTPDELWLLEHDPIFTQGISGKEEHLLSPGNIPVVNIDRGGQVTYHGPGQCVAYVLLDIRRAGLSVRGLVSAIELAVTRLLARYAIEAVANPRAPGVYVNGRKIAALGLKVSRGRCYHGVALNVDMDLTPFAMINPCGYPGLEVVSMASLTGRTDLDQWAIGHELLNCLEQAFAGAEPA